MERLETYAARWLPDADPSDPQVLGRAFWLERNHWERLKVSVQNAIADAIKGK